jgi:hypothetical protein
MNRRKPDSIQLAGERFNNFTITDIAVRKNKITSQKMYHP